MTEFLIQIWLQGTYLLIYLYVFLNISIEQIPRRTIVEIKSLFIFNKY